VKKWLEPALIALVLVIAGLMNYSWPSELEAGQLAIVVSLIFLVQTLVRDLVLYAASRRDRKSQQRREAQCFCVESGVGVLMVLFGLVLFLGGLGGTVSLQTTGWLIMLGVLLGVNYLMKDLVFGWNPWRVYRDPDHLNIIPRF